MGALDKKHKRKNDKEAFREYYVNCEEEYELDWEGKELVGKLVRSNELVKLIKSEKKKGDDITMCRAINELIEEGRQEGVKEGRKMEKAKTERAKRRAEKAEKEVERLKKQLEDMRMAGATT